MKKKHHPLIKEEYSIILSYEEIEIINNLLIEEKKRSKNHPVVVKLKKKIEGLFQ